MQFSLKYGLKTLAFELDEQRVAAIIVPSEVYPLADASAAVRKVLTAPYGTPPLLEMLEKVRPQNLVVVVNDITRPTPYSVIMPPLLEVFDKAGIPDSCVTLVTATGIHDPPYLRNRISVYMVKSFVGVLKSNHTTRRIEQLWYTRECFLRVTLFG